MPKIIENIRDQLMLEAKRQIAEQGYKCTTIRSVASGCGVAVGTVYNYFSSKDMLIASFILQDWVDCVRSISAQPKEDPRRYLEFIHISLQKFAENHRALFADKEAAKAFNAAFSERHRQLRSQLAELIIPIAKESFTAEYIAEALLTWTMAGKSFDEIYALLPDRIK